jgi:hypothetical protein
MSKIPQAPSIGDIIGQYNSALPSLYQTNYNSLNSMFPGLMGLPGQMSQIASQGMNENMPTWMQQEYQSDLSARLGNNVSSPIGADYMSRGLMNQAEDWRRYYQNMGMQLSGQIPQLQNAMTSGFNPGQALSYASSTYSPYLQALQNQGTQGGLGAGIGSALGGAGGFLFTGGNPMGAMLGAGLGGSLGGGIGSQFNRSGVVR